MSSVLFDEPGEADAAATADGPVDTATNGTPLTDTERTALDALLEDLRRLGLVEFSAP